MSQRQDQCLFFSVHLYVHVALAKFFRSLCSFLEINMKEERGKVIMVSTVRPHCKQTSLQKARENSQQRDSGRNFEENDSNLERKYLFLPLIIIIDPDEKKKKKKPSITPTHHVLSKLGRKGRPEAALRRVFEHDVVFRGNVVAVKPRASLDDAFTASCRRRSRSLGRRPVSKGGKWEGEGGIHDREAR